MGGNTVKMEEYCGESETLVETASADPTEEKTEEVKKEEV